MATTNTITIPWTTGDGNIYVSYTGTAAGDKTLSVSSDVNTLFSSRSQDIVFTYGSQTKTLTVIQEAAVASDAGFYSSDGMQMLDANGVIFLPSDGTAYTSSLSASSILAAQENYVIYVDSDDYTPSSVHTTIANAFASGYQPTLVLHDNGDIYESYSGNAIEAIYRCTLYLDADGNYYGIMANSEAMGGSTPLYIVISSSAIYIADSL